MKLARKYITRIDHRATHGWFVRVYRSSQPVEPRLFSDGVYGGKQKALKAAQAHRDRICRKVFGRSMQSPARRTWGKGVYLREWINDKGYPCKAWLAFWSEDGRQIRRSFSVRRHGVRRARELALEARRRGLEKRR